MLDCHCQKLSFTPYGSHIDFRQAQSILEPMAEAPDPPHNILNILTLLVEVYLANNESDKASECTFIYIQLPCRPMDDLFSDRIILRIEELNLKSVSLTQSKHGSGNDGKDKGELSVARSLTLSLHTREGSMLLIHIVLNQCCGCETIVCVIEPFFMTTQK